MTLAPQSVFKVAKLSDQGSFRKVIEAQKGYRIGGFSVIPFHVAHDVPCFGFIIDHADMGKLLFVTDTMMLEYTFEGLNHIMIEANYADDLLNAKIDSGKLPASMRKRLLHSHMEIETTKSILRSNDLSRVSNIILIHLSNSTSDEKRFIDEIRGISGKTVYAADKGLTIDLSLTPY